MVDKKQSVKPRVAASPELLRGLYANSFKFSVSNSESILDFAMITVEDDKSPQGIMVSRVIMNHELAEKLATGISQALKTHSEKNKQAK